jgi:hypothetical protein
MARTFDLPAQLVAALWEVKIRDKERTEPPHASVLRGTQCWRWGLRERAFLDARPAPSDVPKALVEYLGAIHGEMCGAWDEMYPHNPVTSEDNDDD